MDECGGPGVSSGAASLSVNTRRAGSDGCSAMADAYDIFISYSRANSSQARLINDKLRALGFSVFFDSEGIDVGAEFPEVIDRAVKGAKAVLGLWTHEAVQRRWIRIESRIALDRGTLVAAALAPMKPEDLPAEFYNVNVVDLSSFRGEEQHPGWQSVLRAIGRKTGRSDLADQRGEAIALPAAAGRLSGWKIKAAVALALLLFVVAGYVAATRSGLIGGPAISIEAIAADLNRIVEIAQPILGASAQTQIDIMATKPFPKVVWAAAQLVAAHPGISPALRTKYEGAISEALAVPCACLSIDGAKSAIVSIWILLSYTENNKAPPPNVLAGVLAAQSPQGWWSAALDASNQSDNASLTMTVMAVLALDQVSSRTPSGDPLRSQVDQARDRAVAWIRTNRPDGERMWADFPNNTRRTEHIAFSAMATTALLPHTRGADAASLAKSYVRALKSVAPSDESFSNNIIIALSGGGEPYYDTYRHVPMGWEIRALIASYPLLEPAERDRANVLLSDASKLSLNIGRMSRQDWMLAEHVFNLRSALVASAAAKPAPPNDRER